jgi:hypothetical protein
MGKASLKGLHRATPFNLAKELLKKSLAYWTISWLGFSAVEIIWEIHLR